MAEGSCTGGDDVGFALDGLLELPDRARWQQFHLVPDLVKEHDDV